MFEGIRYFLDLLEVKPFWPIIITLLSFGTCLVPYKPILKIKESKDKNGNKEYTIFRYRDK